MLAPAAAVSCAALFLLLLALCQCLACAAGGCKSSRRRDAGPAVSVQQLVPFLVGIGAQCPATLVRFFDAIASTPPSTSSKGGSRRPGGKLFREMSLQSASCCTGPACALLLVSTGPGPPGGTSCRLATELGNRRIAQFC